MSTVQLLLKGCHISHINLYLLAAVLKREHVDSQRSPNLTIILTLPHILVVQMSSLTQTVPRCVRRNTIEGAHRYILTRNRNQTSGSWFSVYDGATWTASSDVDIDHLVPLKEAWLSGARDWTTAQREALANDLTRPQLLAVTVCSLRV